jgi:hypothetical protein
MSLRLVGGLTKLQTPTSASLLQLIKILFMKGMETSVMIKEHLLFTFSSPAFSHTLN